MKIHLVFNIIKWIGVAYLVYFGLSKIFEKVELVDEQEKINSYNPKKAFFSSILINLTNVKATIFLVAFIPQFINPNESIFFQIYQLGKWKEQSPKTEKKKNRVCF